MISDLIQPYLPTSWWAWLAVWVATIACAVAACMGYVEYQNIYNDECTAYVESLKDNEGRVHEYFATQGAFYHLPPIGQVQLVDMKPTELADGACKCEGDEDGEKTGELKENAVKWWYHYKSTYNGSTYKMSSRWWHRNVSCTDIQEWK